jgi:uncharacterized protein
VRSWMKNMIVADTGFFVALGNQDDQIHDSALEVISILREPLITTYPVITETCYLLVRDAGLAVQLEFLSQLAEGAFEIFTPIKMLNRVFLD